MLVNTVFFYLLWRGVGVRHILLLALTLFIVILEIYMCRSVCTNRYSINTDFNCTTFNGGVERYRRAPAWCVC